MNNTIILEGDTSDLPCKDGDRIIAMLQVQDADLGCYEQRVVVWQQNGRGFTAARIEATPMDWMREQWDVACDWPSLSFNRVELMPAVLEYLIDTKCDLPIPEGAARA